MGNIFYGFHISNMFFLQIVFSSSYKFHFFSEDFQMGHVILDSGTLFREEDKIIKIWMGAMVDPVVVFWKILMESILHF